VGACVREGSPCIAVTPTCTVWQEVCSNCRLHDLPERVKPHLGSSHTRTLRTDPLSEQRVHSKCPSVVLWTPCSGVEWRVFERTIRVWRSGTTCKQPANLAVEGAEESLSILSDYTPTVRPPPKRC
jgi:hypothetical protein